MRTLTRDVEYKLETVVLNELGDFATGLTVLYDLRKATGNTYVYFTLDNFKKFDTMYECNRDYYQDFLKRGIKIEGGQE